MRFVGWVIVTVVLWLALVFVLSPFLPNEVGRIMSVVTIPIAGYLAFLAVKER